jgi:hypothetical protein
MDLFQSEIPSHQQIFPLLSKAFSNVDSRSMKGLQKAFGRGQATSARLTLSPPASPTETFDAELLGEDPRSRQSSNATACTTDSNGTSSRAPSLDPVVAVHMTPLKNELGKASMFVFILATGI